MMQNVATTSRSNDEKRWFMMIRDSTMHEGRRRELIAT
jgi:hypothetical protein